LMCSSQLLTARHRPDDETMDELMILRYVFKSGNDCDFRG